ncbi:hypothetical protein HanIR_Chr11g0516901 [Helianthus annuus]|nr:hypothetical protein HanIR_Chr11g0516901 [Helianthus annuus]
MQLNSSCDVPLHKSQLQNTLIKFFKTTPLTFPNHHFPPSSSFSPILNPELPLASP